MTRPTLFLATLLAVALALPASAQDRKASDAAVQTALDHVRGVAATSAGLTAGDVADLAVSSAHQGARSGLDYVYVQQQISGIDVAEAIVTVGVDRSGAVVHAAGELVAGTATASKSAGLPAAAALARAAAIVGVPMPSTSQARTRGGAEQRTVFGSVAQIPVSARLVYVGSEKEGVRLAWEVILPTADGRHVWNVRLDASTGEEIETLDEVIHESFLPETPQPQDFAPVRLAEQRIPLHLAAPHLGRANGYQVYAMPLESPTWGTPAIPGDARTIVTNPADALASPFGWHDTNGAAGAEFTITRGNNAYAYTDVDGNNVPDANSSPDGGATLDFAAAIDLSQNSSTYRPAATINLFYWTNIIHDVMYQYGFTEAAGNFQTNNYGREGTTGVNFDDAVYAEAQNSGDCNANFWTPNDDGSDDLSSGLGPRPRMQMFSCNPGTVGSPPGPVTDSDLDNGVIVHEYGHGVSVRLTGGAGVNNCLRNAEQMGEGWSDFYGLMLTMEATHTGTTARPIGNFLLSQPQSGQGIRGAGFQPAPGAPYSTNFAVNSATYGDSNTGLSAPHGVGFVWATILWEATWELIDANGFDPDIYDAAGMAGNQVMMNLVTEGLKLQPCSPGFVDGRDAILAADQALYGGAHTDLLWAAFARRGLGASASQGSSASRSDQVEAFDAPLAPGSFAYSPTSISVSVAADEMISETVTLENNAPSGGADLIWSASIQNATDPGAAARLATGTDAFGNTFTDSTEPGGPTFAWEDISGTGTAVSLGDDNASGAISLPFAFPFYGTAQNQVTIGSNGYLTFGTAGNTGTASRTNQNLPSTSDPDGLISMYWDDLNPGLAGSVRYQDMGDGRFIVQFTGVPHYNSASEASTFQTILYESGQIDLQYLSMTDDASDPNSQTVGIENLDGTDGLTAVFNAPYVQDNLLVRFSPPATWVSASPSAGSVAPGATADFSVDFDATGLADGTYTADLVITTNDPATPSATVPLTMIVGAGTATTAIATNGIHLLASPDASLTVDDLAALNLVIGIPGYAAGPPNLFTGYDGTAWTAPAAGTDALALGRAFRWRLRSGNVDYGSGSVLRPLPTVLTTATPNTADVTLDLETDGDHVNMLGNPFGVPLDVSDVASWTGGTKVGNVFAWDASTQRFAFDPDQQIEPWQAFFVKTRPGRTGTLTIPASAAIGSAAWASAETDEAPTADEAFGYLRFDLDGRALDGAPLSDGALALVVGDDAVSDAKLRPLSNAYVAAGFSGGDALGAITALRADGGSRDLPIAVTTVGAESALTLRWDAPTDLPDGWRLTLVDRRTGDTADLSRAGSYAFEAESAPTRESVTGELEGIAAAEADERFVLRIEAGGATADAASAELALLAPFPNPSRGAARVPFSLAEAGPVRLTVVDALGRRVAVLADGTFEAGRHQATLATRSLAAGTYVLRLEAGGQVLTQRATIVR